MNTWPTKLTGRNFRRALIPMLLAQQQTSNRSTLATKINTNVAKNLELWPSVEKGSHRQVVVLLSWMLAKQRHLRKYDSFYTKQGLDVLCVRITPWQMLWPASGSQIVAKNILDFLATQPEYKNILIHAFSVGAYVYGEMLVHVQNNLNKYQPVTNKIIGQIFDSAVDWDGIPQGFSKAVTDNKVMQKSLELYTRYHLKTFYNLATKHYLRASDAFHENFINAPSLFYFSKTDPVGTAEGNLRVIRKWEMNGIPVYAKCWESSPHVSHLHHHPDEYLEELSVFLERLGILAEPHRRISKL
uniref:Transmembrane protein 53 n=1 Tax=Hemiscolopendra marginata TaxID=943146 RepID=A0A646QFE6_9MYRI